MYVAGHNCSSPTWSLMLILDNGPNTIPDTNPNPNPDTSEIFVN